MTASLKSSAHLDPLGTARRRWLERHPLRNVSARPVAAAPDPLFDEDLRVRLVGRGVSPEVIHLAHEAVAWTAEAATEDAIEDATAVVTGVATGATAADRRAFALLLVAMLEAVEDGSTLLPLSAIADRPGSQTPAFLERLGLTPAEQASVAALLQRVQDGTAPPAIADLFGAPGARRPFVIDANGLYLERLWAVECELAGRLREKLATTPPPFPLAEAANNPTGNASGKAIDKAIDKAIEAAMAEASPQAARLTDEQAGAVRAALAQPLTVITGGPGTGKTSVAVVLVRALLRLGVSAAEIALSAPTGRAAQRMEEGVGAALASTPRASLTHASSAADDGARVMELPRAQTLHRLLGWGRARAGGIDGEHLAHGPHYPVPFRVVIVDEASMVDVFLMNGLLGALGRDTRLVLLGDADQLPSIRAGAVLADLARALPANAVARLTRSHRMSPADPAGAEILQVANAVNAGSLAVNQLRARAMTTEVDGAGVAGVGVECLPAAALPAFLAKWRADLWERFAANDVNPYRIYDVAADGRVNTGEAELLRCLALHSVARLLCVTRRSFAGCGADDVNAVLAGAAPSDRTARIPMTATTPRFTAGQPVMVSRNDYKLGLFNGDQGVVIRMRRMASVTRAADDWRLGVAVRQGNTARVFALDDLASHIELAFAVTIHKAQGSEFEQVAIVLPAQDLPLLSRELLYTALSRARRSVVILGDPDVLALAVARPLQRSTGLPTRLG